MSKNHYEAFKDFVTSDVEGPNKDYFLKEAYGWFTNNEEGLMFSSLDKVKSFSLKMRADALAFVDIITPEWSHVAARVELFKLYLESSMNRTGEFDVRPYTQKYGDFVQFMIEKGLYSKEIFNSYSEKEIEQAGSLLNGEKDKLFNYIGIHVLSTRYLAASKSFETLELPQERMLAIALTLFSKSDPSVRMQYIKESYWALANLYMTVATPTLSNSGKNHGQYSSCFVDTVEDSLDGIYLNNWDNARVSKNGGGLGVYIGKIRAQNSSIRGFEGVASGTIPWIKQINNTAVSVDQLGQRQGAISIWQDMWHKDLLKFLDLATTNGDERQKARDIFTGLSVPDYFMELAESDENGRMKYPEAEWHLFDPFEIEQVMGYRLEDSYDEEEGAGSWREKYKACVANEDLSRTTVKVKSLLQAMVTTELETGILYRFYRDEVNRKNPNKHKGMIYCSNLCTEITQNMSATEMIEESIVDDNGDELIVTVKKPGDYVVCNLSSINLGKAVPDGVLKRLISIQVRMLDNVIDVNNLPLVQATRTNKKYRAVGLGTFGWHHLLAVKNIDFDSPESVELADSLYEEIAYETINASADLAIEKGAYPTFEGSDWQTGAYFEMRGYDSEKWNALREKVTTSGIRNGHLMAVAPNSSTALIAGSTQGIDPFYYMSGMYFEEKKDFKIPVIAPAMSPKTYPYYFKRSAFDVDIYNMIQQNARRQRHIDQSISFNLYVPNDIKAKDLLELHRTAWRNKLKTTYYTHNESNRLEDNCDACQ